MDEVVLICAVQQQHIHTLIQESQIAVACDNKLAISQTLYLKTIRRWSPK